ncbi:hypothetical protein JXE04_02000 [Patescibacteria group bacterium]|nr:hypothetical protein [Patescibacteria group bacterium]
MDNITFANQAVDLIDHLNGADASKFFRNLDKETADLLSNSPEYSNYFYLLKFLAIPFLDDKEIANLLAKRVAVIFRNDDLDLVERLKNFFISVRLPNRDDKKSEFVKALTLSKERLFKTDIIIDSDQKLITTGDCLSDFIANVGMDHNVLKEAQYFSKRLMSIPEEKKKILKKLFAVYKYLSTSSSDPYGFEDDLLIRTEDGRSITTHNGEVIVLHDPNKDEKNSHEIKNFESGSFLKNNDLFINDKESEVVNSKEENLVVENVKTPLAILSSALEEYSPSSLEYKAIKQEIESLRNKKINEKAEK